MVEDEQPERTRSIRQATEDYALMSWRTQWPALRACLLGLAGMGLVEMAGLGRGRPWTGPLLVAGFACIAVGFSWFVVRGFRALRDWRHSAYDAMDDARRGTGVSLEPPALPRRAPRYIWDAYAVACVIMLAGGLLAQEVAARFLPLVIAGAMAMVGTLAAWIEARVRGRVRWVNYAVFPVYLCYAAAVAAGLPQPLGSKPWISLTVSLIGATVVQMVVSEVYSRRQLRRLQSLLAEHPGEGADGRA